jgi:hypothetical protein
MRRDQRAQRSPLPGPTPRAAAIGFPTTGYALIVDGQAKAEFKTWDGAQTAAKDLKGRFPILQVKIYDAENRQSEKLELAAA